MPYATVSDVNAVLPAKFAITSSTVPTSTQVEAWIAEFGAELDGWLKTNGYSTPVTGTNDLLRVRRIIVEAVACKLWPVRSPADDDQLPAQVRGWCDTWAQAVKSLADGSFTLVDQSRRKKSGMIYPSLLQDDD